MLGRDPAPLAISCTEEGDYVMTLGSAAFNMFTPTDLVVVLGVVMNPLQPSQEDGSFDYANRCVLQYSYAAASHLSFDVSCFGI